MGTWGKSRIAATLLGGTSIICLLSACTFFEPDSPTATTSPSEQAPSAPAPSSATARESPTTNAPTPSNSSPSSAPAATQGTISMRGSLVLELVNPGLPAGSDCQASGQNTGGVTSGGGALGGASAALGTVSLANATEFNLLPGVYDIRVLCTAGDDTWQAEERSVTIRTDEGTDVRLELSPTP